MAQSAKKRTDAASRPASLGMTGRVIAGVVLTVLLIGGVGGWAATAQLAGAVVAQGLVAVDQDVKAVQHRDGGIVHSIEVREGDAVEAGQVMVSLEDAQTRAELTIVRTQIIELSIRRARLIAEREGGERIEWGSGLDLAGERAATLVSGETRLFDGNRSSRDSQKQQIELTIRQIGDEISGLKAQRRSTSDEIALVEAEFARMSKLLDSGLAHRSPVHTIERDLASLAGELGEVDASIARAATRISELRLQIIAIDETARTEAQRELSQLETRLSELSEREIAIEDRLLRTDIRAPIAGVVNEVNVHTIGGVVSPAEILVTIVPHEAELAVEVRIAPTLIDQVSEEQTARLRFVSFNQRTTPEVVGHVQHLSAATSRDTATGETFYIARVALSAEELAKLPAGRLLPGMPVEVYIQTEERTALSYFAKPVTDQFSRAFRER